LTAVWSGMRPNPMEIPSCSWKMPWKFRDLSLSKIHVMFEHAKQIKQFKWILWKMWREFSHVFLTGVSRIEVEEVKESGITVPGWTIPGVYLEKFGYFRFLRMSDRKSDWRTAWRTDQTTDWRTDRKSFTWTGTKSFTSPSRL